MSAVTFSDAPPAVNPAARERPHLTPRETQALDAAADGLTNAGIAERLGVSPNAAKALLATAAEKLGTGDRAGMVGVALRAGILRPRPLPAGVLLPAVRPVHATVVGLIAQGCSNGQIAAATGVSVGAGQARVKWWLVHFGARNRAHAVRLAADAGVRPLNGPGAAR